MNILVTGSKGFIGKHLVLSLKQQFSDIGILEFDIGSAENLEDLVKKSDFIFHCAGVNRPKDESEFQTGNTDLTEQIISILRNNNLRTPIAFTSSIQAEQNNLYGISKKKVEDILIKWHNESNSKVYIYRFPNVFGKWCRPNYNSVIATFCYNIANNLPIQINDPETILKLIYIDDVVKLLISSYKDINVHTEGNYVTIDNYFEKSLGGIADLIHLLNSTRKSLILPDFNDKFTRYLYATFISYLPLNNFDIKLDKKEDNRGYLYEILKSHNFGQIFISKTKPGITRGNHWHHTKVEKFIVIQGDGLIKFRSINSNEIIEYKVCVDNPVSIDIPTGYTHSITNIGDDELITLFWSDEIFDPDNSDTFYEEV